MPFFFFFLNSFLIGGKLLYNAVSVSAIQQSKPAIIIISLLSLPPLPHLTPQGHHRAPGWAPCVIQQLLISYLFYTWQRIYVDTTSPFIPLFLSPTVSTSPFSISVSSFLLFKQVHEYQFSGFHVYALIYGICFPLSDFTLYNRLQVHPPHWN